MLKWPLFQSTASRLHKVSPIPVVGVGRKWKLGCLDLESQRHGNCDRRVEGCESEGCARQCYWPCSPFPVPECDSRKSTTSWTRNAADTGFCSPDGCPISWPRNR